MKRLALASLAATLLVTTLSGCDEDKKKEELLAKGGVSSASTTAAAPPSAAPAASAAPSAAPSAAASAVPKKDVICQAGPELTLTDPDIEAQVRLKLAKKPGEPLKMSDLANLKSLDLTKKLDDETVKVAEANAEIAYRDRLW